MMRAEVEDSFEDVAYSETALVYQALEDFPVTGQAGLVVGSIMPWAEAILFLAGAPLLSAMHALAEAASRVISCAPTQQQSRSSSKVEEGVLHHVTI